MTKKHKVWIGVSAGIAGLFLGYFGVLRPLIRRKNKVDVSKKLEGEGKTEDSKAVLSAPSGFPLGYGSIDANTGGAVSAVQKWLMGNFADANTSLSSHGGADGVFGSATLNAVKNHINASGTVSKDWYDVTLLGKTASISDAFGKKVYAKTNGVVVYSYDSAKADGIGAEYKTAKQGEWLGTVTGEVPGNSSYWLLNDIRMVKKDFAYSA